jgi:hypothetical protein
MKPSSILHINTMNDEWCDKDIVMLHACFQLLTDCIEKESLLDGHVDWEVDNYSKGAKIEIQFLYEWWMERRSKADHGVKDLTNVGYESDDSMLIRLIEVRRYLWT